MQGNPAFCFKGHLNGGGCPLRLQGREAVFSETVCFEEVFRYDQY